MYPFSSVFHGCRSVFRGWLFLLMPARRAVAQVNPSASRQAYAPIPCLLVKTSTPQTTVQVNLLTSEGNNANRDFYLPTRKHEHRA
jgi:hypothetical protein